MEIREADNLAFKKSFGTHTTLEWDPVYDLLHRRSELPIKFIDGEGEAIPCYNPEDLAELGCYMSYSSEGIIISSVIGLVGSTLNNVEIVKGKLPKGLNEYSGAIPSHSPEDLTELDCIINAVMNKILNIKGINGEAIVKQFETDKSDLIRFNMRATAYFQRCRGLRKHVTVEPLPNDEISITFRSPARKNTSESVQPTIEPADSTSNLLVPDFRLHRTKAANRV